MTPELDGRLAVVTGAAAGIGFAAAAALGAQGARLVLLDRDAAGLERAARALESRGVAVATHVVDVAHPAAVESAARRLLTAGGVDVLVNSAGIQRYGTVVTTPVDVWDEVMSVNVRGMYLVSRQLLPSLEERAGAIVNVSSVQALGALPGAAAYVASKHAVLGLTRAMALDHAPRVRVNCVAPGSVDTPMLRTAIAELAEDAEAMLAGLRAMHPLGRIATADDVGAVIAFLAGPRAAFVSGACWEVDGALMAKIG